MIFICYILITANRKMYSTVSAFKIILEYGTWVNIICYISLLYSTEYHLYILIYLILIYTQSNTYLTNFIHKVNQLLLTSQHYATVIPIKNKNIRKNIKDNTSCKSKPLYFQNQVSRIKQGSFWWKFLLFSFFFWFPIPLKGMCCFLWCCLTGIPWGEPNVWRLKYKNLTT